MYVGIYLCTVVCNFMRDVDLWNHDHHNEDTELFYHQNKLLHATPPC